jgi:hypothetical protein
MLARTLVGENIEILVFCRGVVRGELNGHKNEIIACLEGLLMNWRCCGEAKHAGLQQKERRMVEESKTRDYVQPITA